MPAPKPPGSHDSALVRGADGKLYVVDKKGTITKLKPADVKTINDFLDAKEEELKTLANGMTDGTKTVAGGVNLCVPEMFP